MACKTPTEQQLKSLAGGTPLAAAFNPQTGALCLILPTGQKRRYLLAEWQAALKPPTKPEKDRPPVESPVP